MKTIEVSDEMYDRLMALAHEITTQDPRGTRAPHIFQVREWKRVYDWGLNGNQAIWVDQGNQSEIETYEELVNHLDSYGITIPDNLKEMWEESGWWDLKEFLEQNCSSMEECSYSLEPVYHNYFLTEKACKEHVRLNGYHYNNPDTYLQHAWRNPDMELVAEFFCGLLGKTPHQ
jgi:hypothetical protein